MLSILWNFTVHSLFCQWLQWSVNQAGNYQGSKCADTVWSLEDWELCSWYQTVVSSMCVRAAKCPIFWKQIWRVKDIVCSLATGVNTWMETSFGLRVWLWTCHLLTQQGVSWRQNLRSFHLITTLYNSENLKLWSIKTFACPTDI